MLDLPANSPQMSFYHEIAVPQRFVGSTSTSLPSKLCSCGSFMSVAAAVTDQMAVDPALEVVSERRKTLSEAMRLPLPELEKMLKDRFFLMVRTGLELKYIMTIR